MVAKAKDFVSTDHSIAVRQSRNRGGAELHSAVLRICNPQSGPDACVQAIPGACRTEFGDTAEYNSV
jgi:hypothetical protein